MFENVTPPQTSLGGFLARIKARLHVPDLQAKQHPNEPWAKILGCMLREAGILLVVFTFLDGIGFEKSDPNSPRHGPDMYWLLVFVCIGAAAWMFGAIIEMVRGREP